VAFSIGGKQMAYLTINNTQYEARTDFKFQRVADDKYFEKDEKGKKIQDGFQTIYANLLEYNPLYLSYFWDCALSHHKQKPSIQDIDEALLEAAGEECDFDPLFTEAFAMLDNAGFFRKQVNKFWKNTELVKNHLKDEEEAQAYEEMLNEMKETREKLNPSA
jgi:hypothetical protein